jgi:lauroyl/myristoyl acyltransferase
MTNLEAVQHEVEAGLLRRAYATPAMHRALPWPLALATVRVRAARLWKAPKVRAHAVRSMDWVLGCTGASSEAIEAAARRWVFETIKRDELTWRPWQTTRFPVEGAEVLAELRGQGRGAIVNFLHHGQYGGTFGSLARAGFPSHVAVLPSLIGPQRRSYEGRRRFQHIRTASTGCTIFPAKGGLDQMRELLDAGLLVSLATDVPGNTPMDVLGRRVSCGSGAARLAIETGAPIVPVTAWRRGSLQSLRLEQPIDPRDHGDFRSLQQAIADAHAPALLAWPEGLMEPLERWRAVDDADIATFGLAETPA